MTTGQANSDQGRASGPQVALVTKSGSNDFHGNIRWYYRTSGPTANDFFDNLNGIGRPKLDRNIPGASLGGRIWKDRASSLWTSRIVRTGAKFPLALNRYQAPRCETVP